MMEDDKISFILDQAAEEEKAYNWIPAANLYENALSIIINDNNIEKRAEIYKKLGYSRLRSANQAETAIQYKDFILLAKEAHEKAVDSFHEVNKKALELECQAEVHHNTALIAETKQKQERNSKIPSSFSKKLVLFFLMRMIKIVF